MPYDAENFSTVRLLDVDPKTITDPKERLMYLRDFLRELPPERFSIWEPRPSVCGSPACILGWARTLFFPEGHYVPREVAESALRLTPEMGADLFWMGDGANVVMKHNPVPTEAANVLDHLIQFGVVDWSKA